MAVKAFCTFTDNINYQRIKSIFVEMSAGAKIFYLWIKQILFSVIAAPADLCNVLFN